MSFHKFHAVPCQTTKSVSFQNISCPFYGVPYCAILSHAVLSRVTYTSDTVSFPMIDNTLPCHQMASHTLPCFPMHLNAKIHWNSPFKFCGNAEQHEISKTTKLYVFHFLKISNGNVQYVEKSFCTISAKILLLLWYFNPV